MSPTELLARLTTQLDDCTGYVVTVADTVTGEVDAYGPMSEADAVGEADDLLRTLRREGLRDVVVRLVRLHTPTPECAAGECA